MARGGCVRVLVALNLIFGIAFVSVAQEPAAPESAEENAAAEPAPVAPEAAPQAETADTVETAEAAVAPSAKLLDMVKQFLDSDDWHYEQIKDRTVLRMAFQGENGEWFVIVQTKEDDNQVLFYSVIADNIPTDKLVPASEFLHRANFGLPIGNFELDFSDGEVRYKTALDVEGAELSQTQIKNYLYLNVITFDRYLNGLKEVVEQGVAPGDAIDKIEAAKK